MIRSTAIQLPGETASLDAQKLLMHITGRSRAWLLSHPEANLTDEQNYQMEAAILQLQAGTPLPYVLGEWEFFGLDFLVTPDVLIPRPETELLVETALSYIRSHRLAEYKFLDIGTGSGIIPISLGVHVPQSRMVAVDISPAALEIARMNAERHGLTERIEFIEADLIPADLRIAGFDIISANLPYIPTETLQTLEIYGKEPDLALDGGADGLDIIRRLISQLAEQKPVECLCLFEIEERQGLAVSQLIRQAFPNANLRIQRDLSGFDRLAVLTLN